MEDGTNTTFPCRFGLGTLAGFTVLRLAVLLSLQALVVLFAFTADSIWPTIIDRIFLVIAIPWVLRHYYRCSWNQFGFQLRPKLKWLAQGTAGGIVLFGVAVLAARFGNLIFNETVADKLLVLISQAQGWQQFMGPFLLGAVLTPVAEEFFYRGMALPAFSSALGARGGLVASAAMFAVFHFSSVRLLEVFSVGVGLGLLFLLTGSLWPGIVAHGFINGVRLLTAFLTV